MKFNKPNMKTIVICLIVFMVGMYLKSISA